MHFVRKASIEAGMIYFSNHRLYLSISPYHNIISRGACHAECKTCAVWAFIVIWCKTHEKVLMHFADNAGPDRPALKRRPIGACAVRLQNQWILYNISTNREDLIRMSRCTDWSWPALFAYGISAFFPCFVSIMINSMRLCTWMHFTIWTGAQHFLKNYKCTQRRFRLACASTQADQSLHSPPEDALTPWLPTVSHAKTLIRLRGCTG